MLDAESRRSYSRIIMSTNYLWRHEANQRERLVWRFWFCVPAVPTKFLLLNVSGLTGLFNASYI